MGRSPIRRAFGLLVAAFWIGACFGGGSDGNAGGAGSAASAICTRTANKFRSCDLLTDGTLRDCDADPADPGDACQLDCIVRASCGDLEYALCSEVDIADATGPFAECMKGCLDRFAFRCDDGSGTVRPSYRCDGDPDCADGSDEVGCEGKQFDCADGTGSVPLDYQCDGGPDCTDGSDEVGCAVFECSDGSGTLPESWRCDASCDCADGSDEAGCPKEAQLICAGQAVGGNEGGVCEPRNIVFVPCTPGEKSVPGGASDPCPQTGTMCAAVGGSAVACCADGAWAIGASGVVDCRCEQSGSPIVCGP